MRHRVAVMAPSVENLMPPVAAVPMMRIAS
jgi:hypothetical protein